MLHAYCRFDHNLLTDLRIVAHGWLLDYMCAGLGLSESIPGIVIRCVRHRRRIEQNRSVWRHFGRLSPQRAQIPDLDGSARSPVSFAS